MSKEVDLYDYIRKYYIVRGDFYYPKISVGPPKKLTLEEVKKEFEKRKQMPD